MKKWLTYERACEVVSYDPESGEVHRIDGEPEPYGGYVRLPADHRYLPHNHGHNFIEIEIDGGRYRFWVHTIVRLIQDGPRTVVRVTGKRRKPLIKKPDMRFMHAPSTTIH